MATTAADIEEFEEQIRLQQVEEKKKQNVRTRTDPDGTVSEWDPEKKAWFPKIDDDFIAKYQMGYGENKEETAAANQQASIPPAPADVKSEEYRTWYYTYYSSAQTTATTDAKPTTTTASSNTQSNDTTASRDYDEYYKNYYSQYYNQQDASDKDGDKDKEVDKAKQEYDAYYHELYKEYTRLSQKDSSELTTDEKLWCEEYSQKYEAYYGLKSEEEKKESSAKENDAGENNGKKENEKGKKGKAPETKKPPEWFQVEDKQNTNVYVTGLPEDMTMEEFEELMKKYGLVTFDVFTRKPKIKLYKDANGVNKGDGLCCYIKQESVDLALNLLDGSEIRGYKIYAERAKFERKGSFDPEKAKKKKLSNKQKRKMKEKQEKLFDWHLEATTSTRPKNERIVVVKNAFIPQMFDKNPAKINEVREDLRTECSKYGEVKKVNIYDHHQEGVATVAFKEPEEADRCIENIHRRYFTSRLITAETWDGKTKYDVQETEEEKQKRLKQWEDFLEGGGEEKKKNEDGGKDSEGKKEENVSPKGETQTSNDPKTKDKDGKAEESEKTEQMDTA